MTALSFEDYVASRGISSELKEEALRATEEKIKTYNLMQARKSRDVTQAELSRDMGVSQAMRQRGAGSVAMFHSRGFSLDCGSAVEEGGRILWRSPDPQTGVVVDGNTLLVFNGTNRVIRGEFQVAWPEFCRGKTFHAWDFRQCLEQEQPFWRDGETVFFDLELQPDSAIEIRSR